MLVLASARGLYRQVDSVSGHPPILCSSLMRFHCSLLLVLSCIIMLANASSDEYRDGDPIHDEEFKTVYEHTDGSINEKVLNMLHHFKPLQSGGLPQWAGMLLFLTVLGCSLLTYMFASGCCSVRVRCPSFRPLFLSPALPSP